MSHMLLLWSSLRCLCSAICSSRDPTGHIMCFLDCNVRSGLNLLQGVHMHSSSLVYMSHDICLALHANTCNAAVCRSCTGGKTEDFIAAAKLMHKAGGQVKVPTYLVPATQKVWMDVYGMPVPGCDGKTASQIFQAAGCDTPASPSCAACLGGPKDTYARMNKPEVCVSTTNRY